MAFGSGYRPLETLIIPNGIYDAEIIDAYFKKYPKTGNEFVEIVVKIKGFDGFSPDRFSIDDRPVLGQTKANNKPVEQADLDKWDRRVTKFLHAFGLPTNETTLINPRNWIGCTGKVSIAEQYDPNESDFKSKRFKAITPVFEQLSDVTKTFINGKSTDELSYSNIPF